MLLDALAHALVDGVCAATLFSAAFSASAQSAFASLILLYDLLAFATQGLTGLLADWLNARFDRSARLRRGTGLRLCTAFSCLLTAAAWVLPLSPLLRAVTAGVGNSLFHVFGGVRCLTGAGGKLGPLGVFVAPGAVGLAAGRCFPAAGGFLCGGLVLCAGAMLLCRKEQAGACFKAAGEKELSVRPEHGESPLRKGPERDRYPVLPVCAALLFAVAVRSFGGFLYAFPWKTGTAAALLLAAACAGGKAAGGFLADRFGIRTVALVSIPLSGLLTALFPGSMPLSLAGQFLLNLTMPLTLHLLYAALPEAPGFSFGLAASMLAVGYWAARSISLPAEWLILAVAAVFFLNFLAMWYACKKLCPDAPKKAGRFSSGAAIRKETR